MKYLPFIIITILILLDSQNVMAQQSNDQRGAFIRSMIVPGWGHYYNNRDDWNRGKSHLATELGIIAVYAGFQHRSSVLRKEYITLANLRAGVNISDRNRSFQIALSEFQSLVDYNEFQLRSRNWNRLLDENNENRWQWQSERDRMHYSDLRSRRDRIKNQLPAFFGLMVMNRVISAISAYNRAVPPMQYLDISIIPFMHESGANGALTRVTYRF